MSINTVLIQELTNRYLAEFIAIREHIHSHPELSFQEFETAKFIFVSFINISISKIFYTKKPFKQISKRL